MSKYIERKTKLEKQIKNTENKIKRDQEKLKNFRERLVELENFEIQSVLKEEELTVSELRSLIKELAEAKELAALEHEESNVMTTENTMNTNLND